MSKPVLNPYKNLTPFKLACVTNFPFIEADFDAITNYELLSLVVKYLNEVIENENTVTTNVQLLAEAFNNLYDSVTEDIANMQEDMTEKFAEQDALIQQYFSDINIQTFVDNKINEMITNGDFEELINNAISEINPNALDDTKKVNVIDLGIVLVSDTLRVAVNTDFFNNSTVKEKILSILNDMKTKGESDYYFKNITETYLSNTYRINAHFSDSPAMFYLYVDYDLASDQLIGYNATYVRSQGYDLTIVDDLVTDYTINYGAYEQKVYDILKANNLASFTPIAPYNVATKQYVDDNAGGGANYGYYDITLDDSSTMYYGDNYQAFNLVQADQDTLATIIEEALTNGYKSIVLKVKQRWSVDIFYFDLHEIDLTNSTTGFSFYAIINNGNMGTQLAYDGNVTTTTGQVAVTCIVTNNHITAMSYNWSVAGSYGRYLPIGNTNQWSPSNDYDPATKRYVDFDSRFDYTSSIGLVNQTDTQSFTGDPIVAYKQNQIVNIRGTIEIINQISISQAGIEIYDYKISPNMFGSSSWTEGYTTAFLYSNGSYYPLGCYISFTANANLATLRFQPFDTSMTTYSAGSAIRFNMTFIHKGSA